MFELTRFEARRRVTQSLAVSGGMFGLVLLVVLIFPAIREAGEDFDEILTEMPDSLQAAFGGEGLSITSIEGFLVLEVYGLVWTMVIGGYLAYAAGTLIAGERERGNVDVLLQTPIPRRQVVVEKFLAMAPTIVLVSLGTFLGVVVGTALIDEAIDLYWFGVLHVLSVPYLLACTAFGVFLSILVDSARRAQLLGFAGVSVSYILEALLQDTDFEWAANLLFSTYFDPVEIVIQHDPDLVAAGILIAATVALLVAAAAMFERTDVTT